MAVCIPVETDNVVTYDDWIDCETRVTEQMGMATCDWSHTQLHSPHYQLRTHLLTPLISSADPSSSSSG